MVNLCRKKSIIIDTIYQKKLSANNRLRQTFNSTSLSIVYRIASNLRPQPHQPNQKDYSNSASVRHLTHSLIAFSASISPPAAAVALSAAPRKFPPASNLSVYPREKKSPFNQLWQSVQLSIPPDRTGPDADGNELHASLTSSAACECIHPEFSDFFRGVPTRGDPSSQTI